MTISATGETLPAQASPAPIVRIIGWCNLAVMAAFLANAILTYWGGWPGAGILMKSGDGAAGLVWIQRGLYVVGIALAIVYVLGTHHKPLRRDAALVSDINMVFIRAAFWVVFLVGLADITISFLRVEGYLDRMVSAQLAIDLGRSAFRGVWVHGPVALIGIAIAVFARTPGFFWLALLVVGAELLIVFSRFVFSYEQAFMADLVRFWYAALFLFASGYTLLEEGHVRVDVFYAGFRRRNQGRVNAVGSILLGMTLSWVILLIGMGGSTSIIVSPMLVFEVTQAGFGMYVKYIMAGFLGIFAISMMVQFVSQFFDSVADARSEPGGKEDHHVSHIG